MFGFLFVRHNPYCVRGRARNIDDNISEKGTLQIADGVLAFQGLHEHVALPLDGIKFFRNRWLGGAIQFRNRANPDWILTTGDESILNDPAFQSNFNLTRMVSQCRVYFRHLRTFLKAGCVALLLVLLFSSSARTWMTGQAIVYVPVNEEIAIGEHIYKGIHARGKFVEDPQTLADLKTISDDVLRGVPGADRRFNFQFHIVIDPSVNAYAIPGGHIVIHSGLIAHAESAEELAGVLGHEMGHVVRRHSLRQLVQVTGLWALVETLLGHDDSVFGKVEDVGQALAVLEFSREHELEADKAGWTFLRQAHIDPHGMENFFERLSHEQPHSTLLTILSTHPAPDDRLRELHELDATSAKDNYMPIAVDFDALRKRMQKIEAAQ